MVLVFGTATADAQQKRFPKPPACPEGGQWRGTFSGEYEAGMFRDSYYNYFGRGCFRSEAQCKQWLYDVRSVVTFLLETRANCVRR
ncbi:MAG: hypothetical protein AAGA88_14020 [Pseudomonadota bacterium]